MRHNRNIKLIKSNLKMKKLWPNNTKMTEHMLKINTERMKKKRKNSKKKLELKKKTYSNTLKNYSSTEREKLIFMVRFKEIWLLVGIYNRISQNWIKNSNANKSFFIMQNIKFNLWKEELLVLKVIYNFLFYYFQFKNGYL